MKNTLTTLIFCLLSIGLIAQVSLTEKEALADLYTSTNGDNWVYSWDLTKSVNEWKGVTIEDNKVISIKMLFNNIDGELPASLGNLEHLQVLELSFNKLSGTIPTEIGNLQELKVLAFNGNDLNGEIPSSIGNLTNLTQLHLSSNYLIGELPNSIADLKYLEVLNVFDNDLNGQLPSKLAYSKSIKELMVAENNFELSNEFSSIVLSNSASIKLEESTVIPYAKEIIAIEYEEGN